MISAGYYEALRTDEVLNSTPPTFANPADGQGAMGRDVCSVPPTLANPAVRLKEQWDATSAVYDEALRTHE